MDYIMQNIVQKLVLPKASNVGNYTEKKRMTLHAYMHPVLSSAAVVGREHGDLWLQTSQQG